MPELDISTDGARCGSDNIPNGHEQNDQHEEVQNIVSYSANMTKSLFGPQMNSYPDGFSVTDNQTNQRREFVKKAKAKDLYGDLADKLTKPSHPLVRPRSIRDNQVTTRLESSQTEGPTDSTIALRDQHKMVIEEKSVTKSAQNLLMPWLNSINRTDLAMDEIVRPIWHPPWKLYRVICGHSGWVHSLTVDPDNMWFASGCRDGLIKIWDIASGKLKITLTGHISGVRGLAVSERHPYLFSCGDDKMVKCWDLEQNQVVRHYHGHLSGVYCLSLLTSENLLVTGGRDSVARVWDMRTKEEISCLTGHTNTVGSVQCQDAKPQIITGSYDTTIRLWDLKLGKSIKSLTNHKKSVRSIILNHEKNSFASGATDNIKQWELPDGNFNQNLTGHDSIVNTLALNSDNVLVSGADNGTLFLWDWSTGYNFQRLASPIQPGCIASEAGILAATFDKSGARLITGESDKTIKMFREDQKATEETHPIDWKPDTSKRGRF